MSFKLNINRRAFNCFGWLAAWELNPAWRYYKLIRSAGKATAPGGEGIAGRAPTFHQVLGPGICLTTEENQGKTSVRAPEM